MAQKDEDEKEKSVSTSSFPPRQLLFLLLLLLASAAFLSLFLVGPTTNPFITWIQWAPPPFAHSKKLIFLLAGQSNMAGRGGITPLADKWDHIIPPSCKPHANILRLSASDRWVPAAAPLHADIDVDKTCGMGPGMCFANAVINNSRSTAAAKGEGAQVPVIGLVPCAVGGSKIWMWARGERLYERAVARGKAALWKGGGRIAAVLWFQGESDTVDIVDAEAYKEKMERLVGDFSRDLRLPALLWIQVALASGEGNFTEIVREAQKSIKLPNVILVDAKGLPLRNDQLHLTTEAQVQLGNMLAQAYLNFNTSA